MARPKSASGDGTPPAIEPEAPHDLSTVPFGLLAEAQARLAATRTSRVKPTTTTTTTSVPKDADDSASVSSSSSSSSPPPTVPAKDRPPSSSSSGPTAVRSSKHAPQQLSSRHQVTRKRAVIAQRSGRHHDPRFLPLADPRRAALGHRPAADAALRTNYAFLDGYERDEMAALTDAIRRCRQRRPGRDAHAGASAAAAEEVGQEREALERQLSSLKDRRRARETREREREVLRRHRAEELEAVRAGKRPFFLKKGEMKSRVAAQRLDGLSTKQREKHERRRRKKEEAKEAKSRPADRRVTST